MLESIGQYGSDYISPSYHDVRIPLLQKAKLKTDKLRSINWHGRNMVALSCPVGGRATLDQFSRQIVLKVHSF